MSMSTENKFHGIEIREYQESDHDEVYSLILSIIETEYKGLPSDSYLFDVDHYREVYSGERDCFWICQKDGKIVGTIAIKEDEPKTALLRRFFVNPNYRSSGIGQKMYKKAMDFCRESKYKRVTFIASNKMDKANKFLKKRDFYEVEDIPLKKEAHHTYGVFKLSQDL